MTGLLFPELLLLLIPAGLAWWFSRGRGRLGEALRVALLLSLVVAVAAPFLRRPTTGRDVVVVVDRSRSMPEDAGKTARELIGLVEDTRGDGDRVGIVVVGREARIEAAPSEQGVFTDFERVVDPDGSDLAAGLDRALQLIPEERGGRILLISDGEETGRDVAAVARRAAARGIEIDVRSAERPAGEDLSVVQLDLPDRVHVGEVFLFTAWVQADRAGTFPYTLSRDGQVLASGERRLEVGMNRVQFRDRLDRAGVGAYSLAFTGFDDVVPDNDAGLGAVLASGPRPILVVNDTGQPSTLALALEQGGLAIEVASPESRPLSTVVLTRYRAVVLENVDASRVGMEGMEALADFVENRGGGLLVTGGKASFGVGGYHESPLDPVLPVSMELRQEHRKIGLALSIVMDRSGSMSMEAQPGVTKMDLANSGAGAAIRLLTPIDAVTVTAVDSEAHRVLPLTPVRDASGLASTVARVESMGGGIYTKNALVAAKRELSSATHPNKHIILFSDAADSEQQEGCYKLADELFADGTTISVIALGTEQDPDAEFLREVARRGGGEIYFTTKPEELPRLFAADTLVAAKASFVEDATAVKTQSGLVGLGEVSAAGIPPVSGYNLTWLVPDASHALVTTDENEAPLLAFHQVGLGRVAAYTGQVGGDYGRSLVGWPGFSELFVTTARWMAATEEPTDWYAGVRVDGQEAVVRLSATQDVELPAVEVRLVDPDGTPRILEPVRVAEDRYELAVPLSTAGVTIGTVVIGDAALPLPPMALVNSPEFRHQRDAGAGARSLRKVASVSGGRVDGPVDGLFEGESQGMAARVVSRELAVLALILLLLEIGGRRLRLWGNLDAVIASFARPAVDTPTPELPQKRARPTEPEPTDDDPSEPPPEPPEDGMGSALSKARSKARKKLDR
ncbi:MAG: VWA domain-containing protein [Proteobacteria bacterium]|nr:VWA domain-containing protein [Pseudomonadota bacterium]